MRRGLKSFLDNDGFKKLDSDGPSWSTVGMISKKKQQWLCPWLSTSPIDPQPQNTRHFGWFEAPQLLRAQTFKGTTSLPWSSPGCGMEVVPMSGKTWSKTRRNLCITYGQEQWPDVTISCNSFTQCHAVPFVCPGDNGWWYYLAEGVQPPSTGRSIGCYRQCNWMTPPRITYSYEPLLCSWLHLGFVPHMLLNRCCSCSCYTLLTIGI